MSISLSSESDLLAFIKNTDIQHTEGLTGYLRSHRFFSAKALSIAIDVKLPSKEILQIIEHCQEVNVTHQRAVINAKYPHQVLVKLNNRRVLCHLQHHPIKQAFFNYVMRGIGIKAIDVEAFQAFGTAMQKEEKKFTKEDVQLGCTKNFPKEAVKIMIRQCAVNIKELVVSAIVSIADRSTLLKKYVEAGMQEAQLPLLALDPGLEEFVIDHADFEAMAYHICHSSEDYQFVLRHLGLWEERPLNESETEVIGTTIKEIMAIQEGLEQAFDWASPSEKFHFYMKCNKRIFLDYAKCIKSILEHPEIYPTLHICLKSYFTSPDGRQFFKTAIYFKAPTDFFRLLLQTGVEIDYVDYDLASFFHHPFETLLLFSMTMAKIFFKPRH